MPLRTCTVIRLPATLQATTITEMALEQTAEALHRVALERGSLQEAAPVDYDTIRATNFYKLFQPTPFGQASSRPSLLPPSSPGGFQEFLHPCLQ